MSRNKFSRGLWIDDEIIADQRLTAGQKMILAMWKREKTKQVEIMAHLGLGINTVKRAFRKFRELGLLDDLENTK